MNDLVYVQYNRKIANRFQKWQEEGTNLNPLVLEEFEWDNEWVHNCDDMVHPGEDLSWRQVDEAMGASANLEHHNAPRGNANEASGSTVRSYKRRKTNTSTSRLIDEEVRADEGSGRLAIDDDDISDDEDDEIGAPSGGVRVNFFDDI